MMKMRAKRMSSRIAASKANEKPKTRKSDPPKTKAIPEKEMREMEIKDIKEEIQEGINANLAPSREEYKDEPPKMPEKGMRDMEIKDIKEEIQEEINDNLASFQAEYKDKPRSFSLESKARAKRMSSRIATLKANEKPKPVKRDPPKTEAMLEKEKREKEKKEIDEEVQEIIDAKLAPFLDEYKNEPSSFVQESAYVFVPEKPVKKQSNKHWRAELKSAFDRRRVQTAINLKNEARILGNVADLPDYLGND